MLNTGKIINFGTKPSILSFAAVAGKKEGEGPLGSCFDIVDTDPMFGEKTFEQAESKLQQLAVEIAVKKAALNFADIDCIFAGDLLNQCIGSSFGLKEFNVPFCGMYGACSTMALSLINAAVHIEAGAAQKAVAVTSSHFCSAERQYRFPLEYGSQRPPSAQWTVTGSGAVLVGREESKLYIKSALIGKICDLGVKDANNMGAAMAPDDVKIRPYPKLEGMVFFYTQIQYLRGFRTLFKDFLMQEIVEKTVNEIYA